MQVSKTHDISNTILKEPKKRGRKPKKVITTLDNEKTNEDNVLFYIEPVNQSQEHVKEYENENENENETDITNILTNDILHNVEEPKEKAIAKKRGRKPKGGKIIQQVIPLNNNKDNKPNVILHLKCSLKDLVNNSLLTSNIECYNFLYAKNDSSFEIISSSENNLIQNNICEADKSNVVCKDEDDDNSCEYDNDTKYKENSIKEVWKKLKELEHNLHINNVSDKKSACFWCTCDFDNPPVYIPKHFIKESYHVYGCFCSPECATAYLMEESIDSSSKFERYYLVNYIYSKIYDYKKSIKPAPNPYYMLDKYYGNLTIQEYRSLLRNERLFLVVDKPLTKILPELHEDNEDFIINNKIIPSNAYQIKKKIQKKSQSKNNIVNEKFGLVL